MKSYSEDFLFQADFGDEDIEFLPLLAIDEKINADDNLFPSEIAVLPLRNTVLFPSVVVPITVGRERSVEAVKQSKRDNNYIIVIAQQNPEIEEPQPDDLYQTGTLARIVKSLKLPDGNSTVIIQGREKVKITKWLQTDPHFKASYKIIKTKQKSKSNVELNALCSSLKELSSEIIEASPNIPSEATIVLKNIENPTYLVNFISSNLNLDLKDKQELLEIDDLYTKAERALSHLYQEHQLIELKNKIQSKVKVDLEKQQRDYFLSQQLKTIQDECQSSTKRVGGYETQSTN